MKKLLGLLLVLTQLLLPCAVLAQTSVPTDAPLVDAQQDAAVTANGVVKSENVYELVAPFSGTLLPFSLEQGDSVKAGDVLMELDTQKVYAPADGTLMAIFIKPGDLCEDVLAQYGTIATIEKDPAQVIEASTAKAYNDEDNKLIHVGETVYFEQSNDKDNEGQGRVISVDGIKYKVEMLTGEFDLKRMVKIYREEKMGNKSCIGEGKVVRAQDVNISANSGRVLNVAVTQGQKVKKGQLLFELIAPDADPVALNAKLASPQDGTLEAPLVTSGQQVYKGQVLAKVHGLSTLKVVAEVDEVDLDRVHVGDSLSMAFDRYGDQRIQGTVSSISRMGVQKQNAAYYNVDLVFTTGMEVLPGMNVTIWLPVKNVQ
ncbi:MAG: biotin/lipoyl-binding protein [Clostridia bacterium]